MENNYFLFIRVEKGLLILMIKRERERKGKRREEKRRGILLKVLWIYIDN